MSYASQTMRSHYKDHPFFLVFKEQHYQEMVFFTSNVVDYALQLAILIRMDLDY